MSLLYIGLAAMLLLALLLMVWPMRQQRLLAVVFSLSLPIIAFAAYRLFGSSSALARFYVHQHQQQQVEQFLTEIKTTDQLIERLQQRLQQQPNSARGWYLLGRVYLSLDRYQQAVSAFAKAYHLEPNPVTAKDFATALFFAGSGHITSHHQQLIDQLMRSEPKQVVALQLKALSAYQRGQYAQAAEHWQAIKKQLPAESLDAKLAEKAIQKARQQLT